MTLTDKQFKNNISKWTLKYLTGEVEWETAELCIKTLIMQHNATLMLKDMQNAIVKEHKENRMYSPYGISEAIYMEEKEQEAICQ